MSNMPVKIYASTKNTLQMTAFEQPTKYCVEYIRADRVELLDSQVTRLVEMLKAVHLLPKTPMMPDDTYLYAVPNELEWISDRDRLIAETEGK